MKPCFLPGDFLLPKKSVDLTKWSVIACDQYTSQLSYWKDVERFVKDVPSTLKLIYPEVYLDHGNDRIEDIHRMMKVYMEQILEESVHEGYILLKRSTLSGDRLGLIGVIDLEAYDYTPGNPLPIRATEGTISSRIPPRVKIRKDATVELSHVMVLVDDEKCSLIEPLYENRNNFRLLYDVNLMMNGGHSTGYAIENEDARKLTKQLMEFQEKQNLFLVVGDGNHSLATAKTCWELYKQEHPDYDENHPSRFAMVEMVNLHSPALMFEPIHRIVFNANLDEIYCNLEKICARDSISIVEGNEIVLVQGQRQICIALQKEDNRLPLTILQEALDMYISDNEKSQMDYIHGQEAMMELLKDRDACGIFLSPIDKSSLFSAIVAGGVLPRKTFSMGEADEKRFYMEVKRIK